RRSRVRRHQLGRVDREVNRHHHDALQRSSDEISDEVVEVHDRRHPLFGRRFRVVYRALGPGAQGTVYVRYRDEQTLELPASVIAAPAVRLPVTRLTFDGAAELLSTAL